MLSNKQKEQLALDIYNWCKQHDLWDENILYYDNKAFSSIEGWYTYDVVGNRVDFNEKKIKDDLFFYEYKYLHYEISVSKIITPEDVFVISFKGALNYVLNGYVQNHEQLTREFDALLDKYNLRYEKKQPWILVCYEK